MCLTARRTLLVLLLTLSITACADRDELSPVSPEPAAPTIEEFAMLETSLGTMTFRFFDEGAPRTVAQVKRLIGEGFYDGVEIYRVVNGHVIQFGAGPDGDPSEPTVPGEFGAHEHVAGVVGLARDADPDSGGTELYICLAPRPHLDGGYATFGKLVEGEDVLRRIAEVPVDEHWVGEVAMHRPQSPVTIQRAYLAERSTAPD